MAQVPNTFAKHVFTSFHVRLCVGLTVFTLPRVERDWEAFLCCVTDVETVPTNDHFTRPSHKHAPPSHDTTISPQPHPTSKPTPETNSPIRPNTTNANQSLHAETHHPHHFLSQVSPPPPPLSPSSPTDVGMGHAGTRLHRAKAP